jgi:ATP-dependent RNA helicase DDX52/ROK1
VRPAAQEEKREEPAKEDEKENETEEQEEEDGEDERDFEGKEEVAAFRKEHRIRVYGSDIPDPVRSFAHLFRRYGLKKFLRTNVKSSYGKPTGIQMQSVPIMLSVRPPSHLRCPPPGFPVSDDLILEFQHYYYH